MYKQWFIDYVYSFDYKFQCESFNNNVEPDVRSWLELAFIERPFTFLMYGEMYVKCVCKTDF